MPRPKGESLDIDIEAFRVLLKDLRKHHDVAIQSLTEPIASKFKELVEYVQKLYNKSTGYDLLYKEVKDVFGDIKSPRPGTVAAFCAGCMMKNNFQGNPGCSVICAGAIPPSNKEWVECQELVILVTEAADGGFFFNLQNNPINKSKAFLYVRSRSVDEFPGLSIEEKRQLTQFGVTYVKLMYYSSKGDKYKSLTSDFILLTEVRTRLGKTGPQTILPQAITAISDAVEVVEDDAAKLETSSNWQWIVLIALIVLLALFFYYGYMKRSL